MSGRIPKQMNLCQVLSWIAFRDERLVTSDPDKLRRDMRRYRRRLVESNPAGDFLKMVQAGKLAAQGRSAKGIELIDPLDWMGISEGELWEIVEDEWAHAREVQ
jgi:hypothetical protein